MGQGSDSIGGSDWDYCEDDAYYDYLELKRDREAKRKRVIVKIQAPLVKAEKKQQRGAKVVQKCKHCRSEFIARQTDVNRGWGIFCSKSCKALFKKVV